MFFTYTTRPIDWYILDVAVNAKEGAKKLRDKGKHGAKFVLHDGLTRPQILDREGPSL